MRLPYEGLAVVLAGGESRRMGSDKAFLDIRGKPLVVHVIDNLRSRFSSVWVSTNSPSRYDGRDVTVIEDEMPGMGPLMGIFSALRQSPFDINFFQACDMPVLDDGLLNRMYEAFRKGRDGVFPRLPAGRLVPTFAFFRKSTMLEVLGTQLKAGRLALHRLTNACDIAVVDVEDLSILTNLNYIHEYNSFIESFDVSSR